jgi:hypothetical protein
MNNNAYDEYKKGTVVDVLDEDGSVLCSGTITAQGTAFATVVTQTGASYDIPYPMLRKAAGIKKTAGNEGIKEEDNEDHHFVLSKEEENKDGVMSVKYKLLVDDEVVSESEEIVMNVYDSEFGWSEPDDFDENKVELLKSTYESGFDLIVESFANIEKHIIKTQEEAAKPKSPKTPEGTPAFVPGVTPKKPVEKEEEPETGNEAAGPEAKAEPAGEEAETEKPQEETTEVVGASLERPSFARSILAAKQEDDRLHNNPQHRINPLVIQMMKNKGIASGDTNDLELADALKNYDFGDAPPKGKTASKDIVAMDFTSLAPVLENGETLNDRELQRALRIAIAAEHDAASFYELIADSTDDPNIKELFNDVAAEEKVHTGEFEKLLQDIDVEDESLVEEGRDEASGKGKDVEIDNTETEIE